VSTGISLALNRARIGLWSDPSSQIAIPHLKGMPVTRGYAGTLVQFVGDDYSTGFRGQAKTKSYAMTCRYLKAEQAQLVALINLFETAHSAPDPRLLLRTHPGQVAGLNESVAVQVFDPVATPGDGLVWDLTFTAQVVNYTFAV
jgi:hypothetical protein